MAIPNLKSSVMSAIKFTAPLEPVPFKRPRFNQRNKVFNDPKYTAFKAALGLYAKAAMQGRAPLQGAIKITVEISRNRNPLTRNFGDADNHLKAVMDALNGICYVDDAQVTDTRAIKHRGEPYISIELEELQ